MTLDDAVEKKWLARFEGKTCQHKQLHNVLKSRNGRDTGYWVCMECGVPFLIHGETLTMEEFETLVKLTNDENLSDVKHPREVTR